MRAIVLEYHDVIEEDAFDASGFRIAGADSYKIDPARFAAHLAAVRAAGVAVISETRGLSGQSAPVLFTFDDGGVSAFTHIAPMLEAVGWRGHFFMTTDRIGAAGFLAAEQLAELHRRGHVIGSHSASHPQRMARCTEGELRDEWRRSLDRLAAILNAPVSVASVPGGYYSPAIARAAAAEGVRMLFTSEPTSTIWSESGCLVAGRFTIRRRTSAAAVARLVARAPTARMAQWALWNVKRVGKTVAGDTYLRVRALALKP